MIRPKETKSKVMNTRTSVCLTLLGLMLLAFSCAPVSVGGDSSTAPGAVTNLAIDEERTESTSFIVQWDAPEDTGTKSDGTALTSGEVGYRIYYLAGTTNEDIPSAESLRQNSAVETEEVTRGDTSKMIENLMPDTRYFVTVISYNSFATEELETASEEVQEESTRKAFALPGTPPGPATNLTIDTIESTSFAIQWTAPSYTGTRSDRTSLTLDEVSYRIYYLEGTEGQEEPSALLIKQNPAVEVKEVMEEDTSTTTSTTISTTIENLTPNTLYFVTVVSYNSFEQLEAAPSNVIKETTNRTGISTENFVGSLRYGTGTETTTTHEFVEGIGGTISPSSLPTLQTGASGVSISYSFASSSGTVFSPDLVGIANDSGVITIDQATNTGTATYIVKAEASGYNTQEVTLTITIIEDEGGIRVSTYYSGGTTYNLPVELGQAIADDGAFALVDTDAILTISNLMDGDFTIHFGSMEGSYTDGTSDLITVDDSTITIPKSDLAANSFSFTDGAVIGISGLDITGTQHVATYYSSNIYGHHDLQAMRRNLMKDYVLKNDIVFPSVDADASNFEAIGTIDVIGMIDVMDMTGESFTGSLNGANELDSDYSISGIQIVSSDNYQGLFRVMEASEADTTIANNLVLRDFKIKGNAVVGSLAGWIKKGTVDNVHVVERSADAGKIEAGGSVVIGGASSGYGGGLLGRAGAGILGVGVLVKIQNTSSAVAVSGTGTDSSRIGGLVGGIDSDVMLTESNATGSVTGSSTAVGGLVGFVNGGTVSGYATTGIVKGSGDNAGGLVGYNSGMVSGYATGSVTGDANNVGGLVGSNDGTVTEGSYATGDVTGMASYIGGFVGFNGSAGMVSGYATGDVTGMNSVGGFVGWNLGGRVSGYATGAVTGDANNVGGLVGLVNGGTVIGYATGGSVTGSGDVGGLVGFVNGGTVTGYARGDVIGTQKVGGLVGSNSGDSTVSGYTRSVVRRSSGSNLSFGKTIGSNGLVNGVEIVTTIYSSNSESQIYDGITEMTDFMGIRAGGADGMGVTIVETSTSNNTFAGLIFNDFQGQWTWVPDGKWPAINIGEVKPAADQPIDL